MEMDNYPPMMTVAQVAEALQVHRQTAYGWCRKGMLPAARLPGSQEWRVRRSDVEAFVMAMFDAPAAESTVIREPARPALSGRDWFSVGAAKAASNRT